MNGQSTSTQLDQLHRAKAEAAARYLKPNGNMVGVGIGKKLIDGKSDGLRADLCRPQAG